MPGRPPPHGEVAHEGARRATAPQPPYPTQIFRKKPAAGPAGSDADTTPEPELSADASPALANPLPEADDALTPQSRRLSPTSAQLLEANIQYLSAFELREAARFDGFYYFDHKAKRITSEDGARPCFDNEDGFYKFALAVSVSVNSATEFQ